MEFLQLGKDNLLQIKGSKKILACTPTQATIDCGNKKIILSGNNIEVKNLNLECEEVLLYGIFANIKLVDETEKKSFLKRVFK